MREARAFHSVADGSTGCSQSGQSSSLVPAKCSLLPVRLIVVTVEGCETFSVAMKPGRQLLGTR